MSYGLPHGYRDLRHLRPRRILRIVDPPYVAVDVSLADLASGNAEKVIDALHDECEEDERRRVLEAPDRFEME